LLNAAPSNPYSTPDWGAALRRIKAAEVFVSLASFPGDDSHRVSLKSVAAYRPRVLQLLVGRLSGITEPPGTLCGFAAMPSNDKSAATILSVSEDQHRAGLLSHWDDDGGTDRTS
jgi:hypothetical protein